MLRDSFTDKVMRAGWGCKFRKEIVLARKANNVLLRFVATAAKVQQRLKCNRCSGYLTGQ